MRASRFMLPLLLATTALAMPSASFAQVAIGVSITVAPPVLPIYVQPPIPAPGYLWTPGYWAWGPDGYYWVPGTWVEPPSVGLLWTPGYWGWNAGVYAWNAGYWGPHVGFYGGVNYGFGYGGAGYEGGRWDNGRFAYNSAVNNFGGVHITNVYNHTVINNGPGNRVSFNGGTGGLAARPTAQEMSYAHDRHVDPTPAQTAHFAAARNDPTLRASVNHGNPAIAATARPGEFHGPGVVQAREAGPAEGARPGEPVANGARPGEPVANGARPGEPVANGARPGEPVANAVHAPAAEPNAAHPAGPIANGVHAAPEAHAAVAAAHPVAHAPAHVQAHAPVHVAHAAVPHPVAVHRVAAHPAPRPAPHPAAHAAPAHEVKRP